MSNKFYVGQQIWIEDTFMYSERESTIQPATIVNVNKTSAYFLYNSSMDRHQDWAQKKYLWDRFTIKDLKVANQTWGIITKVWLTREDYENNQASKKKLEDDLAAAKIKFGNLSDKDKLRFLEDKNYG